MRFLETHPYGRSASIFPSVVDMFVDNLYMGVRDWNEGLFGNQAHEILNGLFGAIDLEAIKYPRPPE